MISKIYMHRQRTQGMVLTWSMHKLYAGTPGKWRLTWSISHDGFSWGRFYIYLHEWLPWDWYIYLHEWLIFYGKLVGKIYTMTMDGSYGIAWLCYIIFMVIQSSWECKGSIGEVFATGCGPYGHWLWCFQSFQSYAAQVMTGFLLKKKTPASCVGFFLGGDLHWNGRHKTRYDQWQHDELIRFYETFDVPNGECLFFLWLIWSIWLWVVVWFFFFVDPDPWVNDPIWRSYFSNGLKPPTRTGCGCYDCQWSEYVVT